ncbi:MAG: UDP-N-acetylmuramoylalanine--D-glutamate ligase, partial [Pseudonocardiales bacterium]|nr:UDP-N-acetylmuramoylalanine--D-glutamate ligase [Pseudonocardiales bacterium]
MADPLPPPGAEVLVCGARVAGAAAVRALLQRGYRVLLSDRQDTGSITALTRAGARFVGTPARLPDGVALVVTSPGFRPDHPLLVDAKTRGVDVLGELELAWRLRGADPPPWLLVTGTNGKTTTVRMLEGILRAGGLRALAVGNVGVSIIDAVTAADPYDVLAVEASSYQLYWSSTIAPTAGALLNIAPDHLDWHGSMAAYVTAKIRAWRGAVAIGNADDPQVAALLDTAPAARRRSFTLSEPVDGQLGVRDGVLTDEAFGGGPLLAAAEVRPPGAHNVANALAAAALARVLEVSAAAIAAGLRSFEPDPHRNQFVAERAGVRYVDDSKATNAHAARGGGAGGRRAGCRCRGGPGAGAARRSRAALRPAGQGVDQRPD